MSTKEKLFLFAVIYNVMWVIYGTDPVVHSISMACVLVFGAFFIALK